MTATDAGASEAEQGGTYLPPLDFKEPSAAGSVDRAAEAAQARAASVRTCMGTSGTSDAEVAGVGADDDTPRVVGEGGLEMGGVGPRDAPGIEYAAAGGISRSMEVGGLETGGVGARDTEMAPAASWAPGAEPPEGLLEAILWVFPVELTSEADGVVVLGPLGGPNFM